MNRFYLFLSAMLTLPLSVGAGEKAAADAIELGSRRHLFVDDSLIASKKLITLKLHKPVAQEVVLTCDQPWEGNTSAYFTFLQDQNDKFRVYYRGSHYEKGKPDHEVTCVALSDDGLVWTRPKLGLYQFAGTRDTNISWRRQVHDRTDHNFAPFYDTNPDCPPDARFKAVGGEHMGTPDRFPHAIGMKVFASADGFRWRLLKQEHVITNANLDSQNIAFWDANKKKYVCYYRDYRKDQGWIRDIKVAYSDDFINWSEGEFLTYTGGPLEHLYTNAIRTYYRAPDLYIGFPTRYQPATNQVEPILITSRDGKEFHKWNEALIPITAPKDRDGNRSNYMTYGLIQVPGQEREMSVYATEAYYKGPASRVRRFTYRTDGLVSLNAGKKSGEMVTKPFTFDGKSLTVNYAVQKDGKLQVEIQDIQGKAISGFSLSDSDVLKGDEIDQILSWNGSSDLSKLNGRPVRLRFALTNGDVYSLKFE